MNKCDHSPHCKTGLDHDSVEGILVELHGMPVDDFVREHGSGCYAAVLASCGNNVEVTNAIIEREFALTTDSLSDFMEYLLFDIRVGECDESLHPFLRESIDYHGLAVARLEAGLFRVVAFQGRYYCFARRSGWVSDSNDVRMID